MREGVDEVKKTFFALFFILLGTALGGGGAVLLNDKPFTYFSVYGIPESSMKPSCETLINQLKNFSLMAREGNASIYIYYKINTQSIDVVYVSPGEMTAAMLNKMNADFNEMVFNHSQANQLSTSDAKKNKDEVQ